MLPPSLFIRWCIPKSWISYFKVAQAQRQTNVSHDILFLWQPVHDHHSVNPVLNSKKDKAIRNHLPVRILLVDDFAPWRRFVVAKLSENHHLRIVGEAADGLEAIQKAEELQPELILLDIGLPQIDGIAAARRVRNVAPNSKILFLSQTLDRIVAQSVLDEGGHGFLVKSDAGSELFAAIDEVMQGKKFVSCGLKNPELPGQDDPPATGHPDEAAITSPAVPLSANQEYVSRHEVCFYSDDSLLLDGFTRFLTAALSSGDAAVFIGTPPHRIKLLERLHAENPDTRTAIRQGRYVALNAAEFISDFIASETPDTDWFLKVVGDLIVAASKGGSGERLRVAVCGECAPILWAQGKAEAAIRLEQLWDQIARTYNLDILCGYSLESLRCEEDSDTLRRICEEHSAVHSL